MKVLILSKNFNFKTGGIGGYYKSLNPYFKEKVDFFFHDSLLTRKYFFLKPIYLIINYIKFLKRIRSYDIIHLNPSLDSTGVIRDGIYLIISKIFKKKVVVFFHGWKDVK